MASHVDTRAHVYKYARAIIVRQDRAAELQSRPTRLQAEKEKKMYGKMFG